MKKELKPGQEITRDELFMEGWEEMYWYAYLMVFYKDKRILFFNPKTEKIYQIF